MTSHLSRSTPLTANRDHEPEAVEVNGSWATVTCSRCGEVQYIPVGDVSTSGMRGACPGMKRMKLGRGSGPKPVSDRRTEKRKARGVRGPLQDFVRGRPCVVTGRSATDPAHLKSVNSGGADFWWDEELGRWRGNVVPLIRSLHEELDGKVGGGGSVEAFEEAHGVDLQQAADLEAVSWAATRGVSLCRREHPYEQTGWR